MSYTPHAYNPNINTARLLDDLHISDNELQHVRDLNLPREIRVPSESVIKTSTVRDTLRIVYPYRDFEIIGVKVPSGVAEQPFGQAAIDGALNRLHNGTEVREGVVPGEKRLTAWFSIENGLFQAGNPFDFAPVYDPTATYADRAVAAVRIPGFPTIVEVSPVSEEILFPDEAVAAARQAEGGFDKHTVGSKLAELGLVRDKQNPHSELSANRTGGPLPRQDQMARVMLRALMKIAV